MTQTNIPAYNNLAETEKKRLQKEFHASDLDYLASYAIQSGAMGEADISELSARIDTKVKGGFSGPLLNSFMVLLCGIFIGCSVFFVLFNKSLTHEAHYEAISEDHEKANTTIAPVIADTLLHADKSAYPKEHFSVHHSGEQIALAPETYENIETRNADITVSNKLSESPLPDLIDLDNIPNAPVVFIADLKVANYKVYYFNINTPRNIDFSGLPAEFADASGKGYKLHEDKSYPAHEIVSDAMLSFSKKNYRDCIRLMEILYDYNKSDVNAQFYLGMSYFYLGNTRKALGYLDEAAGNEVNVFRQEAQFYKALCLLKENEPEGRELLKAIVAKKTFYSQRARELLGE